jgi:integrase/recombinase XerD
MERNRTIQLEILEHRGAKRIMVRFWYDLEIIELIRHMGGAYSVTHTCWYITYSDYNKHYLLNQLKEHRVAWVEAAQKPEERPQQTAKRQAQGACDYIGQLTEESKKEIELYRQYLRGQRYSKSTIDSYITFVQSFLGFYHEKKSAYISLRDIHRYNYEVIIKNNYSNSYQRQFIGAIKLFYSYVSYASFDLEELERPRRERKLPTVLSKEEVRQILVRTPNLKHKAILSTIYAAGMRVGEVLNLRIADLDIDRMQIHIRAAKGKKDRYVKISQANLMVLQRYLHRHTPNFYLFEGPKGRAYSSSSVRKVLQRACEAAGIKKNVSPHTLRHSYATHMLELGIDLRYVQEFLGHKKPETTMIYTHISSQKVEQMVNPLDELFKEELIAFTVKGHNSGRKSPLIPTNDWGY